MSRKLRLTIAYDGADYHGWQTQAELPTVQHAIETVARRVLAQPINLVGASRTDSGVHARGQVAHVVCETPMPADNVRRALNHRLPPDIAIVHVREAALEFHATRHARRKLYRYRILDAGDRGPVDPRRARYCWPVRYALSLGSMQAAGRLMCGTHDFAGFASQGSPRETTVRTVQSVTVRRLGNGLLIDVIGDGFLYNQVRNMVGTLVEIGRGHWSPTRVEEILASADRTLAGPTAPAAGLCLEWIQYPPDQERRG